MLKEGSMLGIGVAVRDLADQETDISPRYLWIGCTVCTHNPSAWLFLYLSTLPRDGNWAERTEQLMLKKQIMLLCYFRCERLATNRMRSMASSRGYHLAHAKLSSSVGHTMSNPTGEWFIHCEVEKRNNHFSFMNESTLCLKKKQDTKLLPITSPNVNRFSKFFHWQT